MLNILVALFYLSAVLGHPLGYPVLAVENKQGVEKIFYMSELKEKEGIESLKENVAKIDILAPQFYGVSAKLKLTGGLDNKLKTIIKEKNIKVMPLVANYAFRQDIMHNLLVSNKAQNEIITALVAEGKKENYIGWQFDFENINYLDKDLYSAFVEKTAELLHKNNLILSVAAVSRSVDFEDTDIYKNWSGAFDYARLAKAVDFISLMTYDDPNSTGPVASVPFVTDVLNYVKDKIPAEKLSFGIPLYNWGWCADTSKKVTASGTYDGLLYIKSNYNCKEGFDSALGSAWLSYFWENKEYKVWHQDKQTFEGKLDIVNQNNFRGFSAWVLGVEDPQIWSTLSKTAK
ncbi:MAG: glycosyl hydrolase family 18 protein [Candidatus Staskawiczbacteria bacterium]|nr:glycosyl hydrolase family 18 protein [Candidatus Staskawiczbacteria bacterium]